MFYVTCCVFYEQAGKEHLGSWKLAVCSGVLTHTRHTQAAVPIRNSAPSVFFKFNFILALLMLVVLAGYVFLSNFLVSQKYILGLRKQQFNQLSTGLPSEGVAESNYGLDNLLLFAQRSGMTEAKDIGMILEESGVALSGYEIIGANSGTNQRP